MSHVQVTSWSPSSRPASWSSHRSLGYLPPTPPSPEPLEWSWHIDLYRLTHSNLQRWADAGPVVFEPDISQCVTRMVRVARLWNSSYCSLFAKRWPPHRHA